MTYGTIQRARAERVREWAAQFGEAAIETRYPGDEWHSVVLDARISPSRTVRVGEFTVYDDGDRVIFRPGINVTRSAGARRALEHLVSVLMSRGGVATYPREYAGAGVVPLWVQLDGADVLERLEAPTAWATKK